MNINYNDYIDMPLEDLLGVANEVRKDHIGETIDLCSIVNAKSGACSEDCKFCAQSGHYSTDISSFLLKNSLAIVEEARKARENGAKRFGIVTSGNKLTLDEINEISKAVKLIKEEVGLIPCGSLGALGEKELMMLKEAGLDRYHHNIETSENYYPSIVSTHDYSERINTIKLAKKIGFEVCSGGIIGIGESWQDRIDMALLLRELNVDSVPINFLVPVKGTPLEDLKTIDPESAIRTIAIFRIILEDKSIKVAAGRESVLRDHQDMIFKAGANSMMIGGYLTVRGRSVEEDIALIDRVKNAWKNE